MESRLVVTMAFGEDRKLADMTYPLIREYARRIGAESRIITEPVFPPDVFKGYEKLQIGCLAREFSRVLYLDADIVVLPDSPDVFSMVPEASVGACDMEGSDNSFDKEIKLAKRELGEIGWTSGYFNSGVLVVSRHHASLFEPPNVLLEHWMSGDFREKTWAFRDQTILNYEVRRLGFRVYDLGYRFNHTRAWGRSAQRFRSHFIHYAGHKGHRRGSRMTQICRDTKVAASPWLRWLRRRFPRPLRLFDFR